MDKIDDIKSQLRLRYIIGVALAVVIGAIIVILSIIKTDSELLPIAVAIAIILIILIPTVITIKLRKLYKGTFKQLYVQTALNEVFDNLEYYPDNGISPDTIKKLNMMKMGDKYKSNDYFRGTYKGVGVEQADVEIKEYHYTYSNGTTVRTEETLFKGRWMIFDFNKHFKSNVKLVPRKTFSNATKYNFSIPKVKLESQEFNKKFNTYANSEQDAFYLLTPSMQEKLLAFVNRSKARYYFCFDNSKLHIGVHTGKDAFEAGNVFMKSNEGKIKDKIASEIKVVTDFIDELNLDNDLFK